MELLVRIDARAVELIIDQQQKNLTEDPAAFLMLPQLAESIGWLVLARTLPFRDFELDDCPLLELAGVFACDSEKLEQNPEESFRRNGNG